MDREWKTGKRPLNDTLEALQMLTYAYLLFGDSPVVISFPTREEAEDVFSALREKIEKGELCFDSPLKPTKGQSASS